MTIITYTPHRGTCEPIQEVHKAEIILHDNYLESIAMYTFSQVFPDSEEPGYRKYAYLIPKNLLSIERTESWHDSDPNKKATPLVNLYMGSTQIDPIYVKHEREADNIYDTIKNWLLK